MLFIVGKRMKADKLQFANITAGTRDNKAFPRSSKSMYEYALYLVVSAETIADFPQSALKESWIMLLRKLHMNQIN